MYNSGDAAEQVVRMSLEGAEFALKITGSAAKNLAAALYTVLKDQKKTKGKARIETMLREKRPMTVYTIKKEDAPEFARQAKGYVSGIHNYYRYATHISKDIHKIALGITRTMQNRLRERLQKQGNPLPAYIAERYGRSKQIRYVSGQAVIPIG